MEKEEWKYDVVPEILDGKNIGDFVDKDVLEKLEELEKEEEILLQAQLNNEEMSDDELDADLMDAY